MSNFDFDMSALQEEFTRVTVDRKPGTNKKTGTFLDKIVKMPKASGYVTLRFLPPLPGHKLPYASCRVHNLATFEERDEKKANNLYCGRVLENKKWVGNCFICEYYNQLYRLADAAKAKGNMDLNEQYVARAKAIKYQEKYYYNAIVLDSNPSTGQGPEDGPLIYSCGIQIHTRILEAVLGNKEMNKKSKGNIFHPVNGRNLKVVKEMKPGGQFPEYGGSEWEDPCPVSEDDNLIKVWLENLNDVHALRKVLAVEEMQRAIRIFEGREVDSKKTFDMSFLDSNNEGHEEVHVSTSVVTQKPVTVQKNVQKSIPTPVMVDEVDEVDDEPLVDEALAESVRAAISGIN